MFLNHQFYVVIIVSENGYEVYISLTRFAVLFLLLL
jgi:hypothetical protein